MQSPPLADAPPPYRTVVFDCDSTLSRIEGIEELSNGPHAAELQRLTAAAMEGSVPLEEVYGRRLELVRPRRELVHAIGGRYAERMVPNADRVIAALHALKKRVVIVSGGVLPAVLRFAQTLEVGPDDVEAVDLYFDAEGAYAGFDEDSPLARRGGKAEVVLALRERGDLDPVALVGDGATDLEAAPHVARFVAFGGVERREPVFAAARVKTAAADFRALVPLLFSPDEIAKLAETRDFAPLLP